MNFRSESTAFLRAQVTKDGTIKTTQVVRKKTDGSLPDVGINDKNVVINKDIPLRSYKGLLYTFPLNDSGFIGVSFPSMQAKNYLVEKRDFVKVE